MNRCAFCHRKARLVQLPLVGRVMWLCRIHGAARVIATMREVIAHG